MASEEAYLICGLESVFSLFVNLRWIHKTLRLITMKYEREEIQEIDHLKNNGT